MKPIYLDYNASTPLAPEVIEEMKKQMLNSYGNPSSSHWYGIKMRKSVEKARSQVASLLGCLPKEIIFTSGGTESNNFAIRGSAGSQRDKGNHLITSSIEHPAVINVCKFLEEQGFEVTYLPVDETGMIRLEDLKNSIRKSTILISVMHANNEVGTIQPLKEISEIARKNNIIVHTDAAQSIGKIPVNVNEMGVDLLSLAGHKLYAPQGVGVLYIREGIHLEKLMYGADHENGLRPGTENVIEIAGLGKACELIEIEMTRESERLKILRDQFYSLLKKHIPDIKLNGHPKLRLPNTLNISFPDRSADLILSQLNNIAASAGAACHSGAVNISSVLKAMKVPEKYALGAIRFSLGKFTTENDIQTAAEYIIKYLRT